MQKISRLFEALTGEINHRPIVGLLTVLVLLLHLLVVLWLLQPTEPDNVTEPLKVMEVALLSEPSPKAEAAPPAPPKKVPPKKKAVKPPVKKKEPVIHKQAERPQPVTDKPIPAQPSPSDAVQKSETPVSGSASANKATKTGNGEARSKAASSGLVELGCPKPKYPTRALSRHIEGWVKIEVIVSTTGAVTNAKVVGAQPSGIFDYVALDATKKCKFKAKIVNGTAVTQRGLKVARFKLTN
ncbi:TonB family protein [Methyloglobulus sp.]|uniref:energy transducer TonB n=1 Tax=Methyloglobulus sp. TaxID=2518622 RepID=UPI003989D849